MSLLLLHAAELLLHSMDLGHSCRHQYMVVPPPNPTDSNQEHKWTIFNQGCLVFLDIQMYLITNTLNTNLRCMKCKN